MDHTGATAEARLRLLYDLGCAFAERIELDQLVSLVIEKCRTALDAEGASVLLHDPDSDELFFPYAVTDDPEAADALASFRLPANQGIAGLVLQTGKGVAVEAGESDPRVYRDVDRQTGTTTRTLLAAPLRARHGPIGVLQVTNHRQGTPFAPDDLSFLEALAGSVAVAIENAQLYAEVKASEGRLRTEVGTLRRDLARHDAFQEIVGGSPAMVEVFRLMESAAAAPVTVLIEGETGTGKELVARALHRASPRGDNPFIAVNCAAVPESLLESELFGHRRGAFTGALQDRAGFFEAAQGGTIFLDEVGEMPMVMQAKLLRVLQEGEIVPVGDTRPRKVDVRVISATNRDLLTEVELKNFREDLYYRLGTFPIHLPPLRQRGDDVLSIASRMLSGTTARHGKKICGFSDDAIRVLQAYEWPGNVRELQNEIERATALTPDGGVITANELSPRLQSDSTHRKVRTGDAETEGAPSRPISFGEGLPDSFREARDLFEAEFVRRTLERCDGNATRAAQLMGMSRASVQNKLRDYGIR